MSVSSPASPGSVDWGAMGHVISGVIAVLLGVLIFLGRWARDVFSISMSGSGALALTYVMLLLAFAHFVTRDVQSLRANNK